MIKLKQLVTEYVAEACEGAVVNGDYCIIESQASRRSSRGSVLFSRYFSSGSYICAFYFWSETIGLTEHRLIIARDISEGWKKGLREFDIHKPDSLSEVSKGIKEIFAACQPDRRPAFVTKGDPNYEFYKNRPAVTRKIR